MYQHSSLSLPSPLPPPPFLPPLLSTFFFFFFLPPSSFSFFFFFLPLPLFPSLLPSLLSSPLLPLPYSTSPQNDTYKLHRIEDGPSYEVELSRDDLLQFYREMILIREMETKARELYQDKKIRGFLHLYIGQVSIPVM